VRCDEGGIVERILVVRVVAHTQRCKCSKKKVWQLGMCPLPQPHSSVHSVCGPKGLWIQGIGRKQACACVLPIAVEQPMVLAERRRKLHERIGECRRDLRDRKHRLGPQMSMLTAECYGAVQTDSEGWTMVPLQTIGHT